MWLRMPQGGKKTPFSGKLKKAQLQAKRERKVKNCIIQFWTNYPDSRLQEVVTWANTQTTQRLEVLVVVEGMKRRRMVMVDRVVISR